MKKADKTKHNDELREEYNLAELEGGVRGKYAAQYKEGSNIVVLDPDVSKAFPNAEAVNEALRLLMAVAKSSSRNAT